MKNRIILQFVLFLTMLSYAYSANETTTTYYEWGKLVQLQPTKATRALAQHTTTKHITFYKKEATKQTVGVTNEIIVQCKPHVECKSFLLDYPLKHISKLTKHIYLIQVATHDEVFSLSRDLYESGEVTFAHPNFIKARRYR